MRRRNGRNIASPSRPSATQACEDAPAAARRQLNCGPSVEPSGSELPVGASPLGVAPVASDDTPAALVGVAGTALPVSGLPSPVLLLSVAALGVPASELASDI